MNRRNFFGLLAGLAGALGLRAKAPVKLIEFDPPDPPLDPHVRWGPGIAHPHWRVPQGRWTFVEDK